MIINLIFNIFKEQFDSWIMKGFMMKKQVVLRIKDGMVELVSKPDDIEIIIRDYDVSDENTITDEYGNECYEIIL